MLKIRTIENLLLKNFGKGFLRGTTHTSIGQEAIAVAALAYSEENDIVVSNHRCHGHFLAYGGNSVDLMEEIKGSFEGVCHGQGGSQHLQFNNFYSNGILGGMAPVAAGMALAEKLKGSGAIAISFIGDGTLGEGTVYESFNMVSLWDIPILYVIENNRYAQSTSITNNLAGSISKRAEAFGIETAEIESNDIGELLQCFQLAFQYLRNESKPFCQIVNTYRLGPHSKGDDFRDLEEINLWREKDPLLLAKKYFKSTDLEMMKSKQEQKYQDCFENVFSENKLKALSQQSVQLETDFDLIPVEYKRKDGWITDHKEKTMAEHLNQVLRTLMEQNQEIVLIGEDLLDPYGGAFKITQGLSTQFSNRVFSSPISEAGITGIANGMAIRGFTSIVEIMFGDFTTLIMDQIVNHATKFRRMYGGRVLCPVIVRTPMGGYRGYGPTHSQSLEKIFFGVPGLVVLACNLFQDQQLIWERMIQLKNPVMYVENKALYGQRQTPMQNGMIDCFHVKSSASYFPTMSLRMNPHGKDTDVIILTYGGLLPMSMEVAKKLFIEQEVIAEIVVPSQLSPLPEQDLLKLLSCQKVVVLEEGTQRGGWGAEIAAFLLEKYSQNIIFRRCAAKDTIIPSSKAGEDFVLPNKDTCYALIDEILNVI